ncbi:MAG: hypothetical protein JWN04_1983 [Myxococcaceae bacterium]|nr:hypothetical protein [Myxococcaceae bacterium]
MTVRRVDDVDKVLAELEALERKRLNAWRSSVAEPRGGAIGTSSRDVDEQLRELEQKRQRAWKG